MSNEFHGCKTGDCPHMKQADCDEAIKKSDAEETAIFNATCEVVSAAQEYLEATRTWIDQDGLENLRPSFERLESALDKLKELTK